VNNFETAEILRTMLTNTVDLL